MGLCLSGGAARGITPLGVLRELEAGGLRRDLLIREREADERRGIWWGFKKSHVTIQKGRENAVAAIAEIKKAIERARVKKFLTLKL